MTRLIAPNGVLVDASEADTPIFLAAGYRPAEKEQEKPAPKRTTRKKAVKDEPDD